MKLRVTKKALLQWYKDYLSDDSVIALEMEVNPLVGSLRPVYERELHSSLPQTNPKEKIKSPRMERSAPRPQTRIRVKRHNPVRSRFRRVLDK